MLGFEVSLVERNDVPGTGGHCRLKNHVVAWVSKPRPPQEEDWLPPGYRADVVKEIRDVSPCEAERTSLPEEDRFVLQHEGNGDADLEATCVNLGDQPKRRPAIRSERGYEDIRIEDDSGRHEPVSYSIPRSPSTRARHTFRGLHNGWPLP